MTAKGRTGYTATPEEQAMAVVESKWEGYKQGLQEAADMAYKLEPREKFDKHTQRGWDLACVAIHDVILSRVRKDD